MASMYQQIMALAEETAREITSDTERYMAFLTTAAHNFKYSFRDQLLIFAQRPDATTCAEISFWNSRGRWVNRGTRGIALLADANTPYKLRYVFDMSDTSSRTGQTIPVWQMEARYEAAVVESLENSFGVASAASTLPACLLETAGILAEDNITDHLGELTEVKAGSLLEELDTLNTEVWLKETAKSSVAYMLLTRCSYDPRNYFSPEDLSRVCDFNTPETISILGVAISDIAEMALREIATTVFSLRKAERQKYTVARQEGTGYDKGGRTASNMDGRSEQYGTDLQAGGGLPGPQPQRAGGPEGREVWDAAADLPPQAPEQLLHRDAADRQAGRPLGEDRPAGQRHDDTAHGADGQGAGSDRGTQSPGPDEMGGADEQHPGSGGRDRAAGPGLHRLLDLPAEEEQQQAIAEAEVKETSASAISQEDIDAVLLQGNGVAGGKYRIFERFQKGASAADNAGFLKEEYGYGGAYPSGLKISRKSISTPDATVTLSWKKVERHIRELIASDRYLSPAEKEKYAAYLRVRTTLEDRDGPPTTTSEPPKAYRLSLGDTVHLGAKEYKIIVLGTETVRLLDPALPLFNKELSRSDFDRMLVEEPLNDHLLQMVEGTLENQPGLSVLEEAKALINEFCQREFESDADFSDLSRVGLAFSTTSDAVTPVEVSADLLSFRLVYEVDKKEVAALQCDDLEDMFQYLGNLDFDEMIAYAEDEYQKQQQEKPPAKLGDHTAEMLQQALLANELSQQTGQTVFGFEEGKAGPVNAPVEKKSILPPPTLKPRAKVSPFVLHPEVPDSQRRNFCITDDRLGEGGPKVKFQQNLAAIQVLQKIEQEERFATPEEQEVLSQYVGWGSLQMAFDGNSTSWADEYRKLKAILPADEYEAARASTLNAHYTSPVVIRAIYQGLKRLGFKTGNILEPSCGIGNFFGMLPETMANSKLYGVELDPITGRIAQQLYQKSSIAVQGFEKTDLPDSFFDAAIGNVPFGSYKVADKRYDKLGFSIHNYFFAKTLDKLRPGGVMAFVTSRYTMDAKSPEVRRYLAERAVLLGAIRLPNNAFLANAGTEAVTDILFFQKKDTPTIEEPDWVHLGRTEDGFAINSYFLSLPEMVLGTLTAESTQYGREECTVIPIQGADLAEQLDGAIQNINGTIREYEMADPEAEDEDLSLPADPAVRNFSYTLVNGNIYYRENSRMDPVELPITAQGRVKGLIGIRDCVRTLILYQTEDFSDEDIRGEQQKLNALYDSFVKKYGRINSRGNRSAFEADSSYFLLSSLEVLDNEGAFLRKADMFSKRTIRQKAVITQADTPSEALALSLAEKGQVDLAYMVQLTGKEVEEITVTLTGVIFLDPLKKEWQTADEYLSGNVRQKLGEARLAAEKDQRYTPNVQALEAVQPADLTAGEIAVRLGATWLPPEIIQEFMFQLFGTPSHHQWRIKVHYSKYTGGWNIEGKSRDKGIKAISTYGTQRISGYKILEDTLNLRAVRIFDQVEQDGKRVSVLNKKETAIAQGKQELIKQAFSDWIWKDPQRRERLCRLYNDRFNSIRPREYDGDHLIFPGMNPEITLRPHQRGAIAHILYGGNTLLAHVVGAGKTFEMVAAAQESKRLGLCQKSMFVVPNHLIEQWAAEYLQLYPSANILVATKKDFEAKNRKRFCGRIATGDYDAIIIGHSQFEKIPMSLGRQMEYLEREKKDILAGIAELKACGGERFSVKQMERAKKSIQAKLDKLNDQSRKDDVVTFEELGIDRLFVDEAHYYKNLAAFSKMQNVGGISQTEAQKSSDLYMKCRYLDELTGGRGVVFATGTPISNTMVEMYTMQKYLQYGLLEEKGLLHFDAWASTFGETITAIELAPEGTGYRSKTRFAKFYNLPELMSMFQEAADIQTADMLHLPVPKANYHNIVLQPSEHQKEMVAALGERAEAVRNRKVDSSKDNMLLITNDGRKLALDQRLLNPLLPDSDTGKVTACAENVAEIWRRTTEQRSTQMVFCDLSTPRGDGSFNIYDDLRDKLIARGIPAEEIAYIHSANTETKKKELFGKVRSGEIRVLIGSTQKMGAGTNVQHKLIALHHLDCPWRPSDLQQREGRIVRQGNENGEVDIFTYVTENTFDSYLYQLVEGKQKFIGQVMTSKSPARSAEDIDETALSYAEIKALCAGNPHIKEKMDLDVQVQRLQLLRSSHLSQKYSLEDTIRWDLPRKIVSCEQKIEGYLTDMATLKENTCPNADGFSPMVIEGTTYTDKKAAGSAILAACQAMKTPGPVHLGRYRGFYMKLSFDTFGSEYKITMMGALRHGTKLGTDILGNIVRLDNTLAGMEGSLICEKEQLEALKVQLASAKEEVEKPFPQEEELKKKLARLAELNVLLDMDKKENEIVDGEVEQEPEAPVKGSRDWER